MQILVLNASFEDLQTSKGIDQVATLDILNRNFFWPTYPDKARIGR